MHKLLVILFINQEVINFEIYVKLFGVEISNNLSFEKYISTLGTKQLNAITRIHKFMSFKEKEILLYSYKAIFKLSLLSSRMAFLLIKIRKTDGKNTRTSS